MQKYCHVPTKHSPAMRGASHRLLWSLLEFQASFALIKAVALSIIVTYWITKPTMERLDTTSFKLIWSNMIQFIGLEQQNFSFTIAINYFKRWRVAFQSLQNLAAFSAPWNNWGYFFLATDCPQVSQSFGPCILSSGFINQFNFL